MNRPMRRKDRELTAEAALALLHRCEYGVLATVGDDGQPYGVPLSYAVDGPDTIYFHSAQEGHKLENLRHDSRVSFTVVGNTRVLPAKFGTEYESAVAFGTAAVVEGEEKRKALVLLAAKYFPQRDDAVAYIDKEFDVTCVVRIRVERLTGKAKAREAG